MSCSTDILILGRLKVANVLGYVEHSEVIKILASMSVAQKFMNNALEWQLQLELPNSLKSWFRGNNTNIYFYVVLCNSELS